MGALLENYYAIGHSSADNYIAQISGQAPNLATQSDCPIWTSFPGQLVAGPYSQVLGEGCHYPPAVQTLGNQLSAAGRSWAAYLQDMGNDPARDRTVSTARGPACGHPRTWSLDRTHHAEEGDQCCAPSRTSSACRTSARRPCRRSGPSARTCSVSRCPADPAAESRPPAKPTPVATYLRRIRYSQSCHRLSAVMICSLRWRSRSGYGQAA